MIVASTTILTPGPRPLHHHVAGDQEGEEDAATGTHAGIGASLRLTTVAAGLNYELAERVMCGTRVPGDNGVPWFFARSWR